MEVEEVAEVIGISVRRLRTWISNGEAPPSRKIGRRRYFLRADLDTWLDERFAAASDN